MTEKYDVKKVSIILQNGKQYSKIQEIFMSPNQPETRRVGDILVLVRIVSASELLRFRKLSSELVHRFCLNLPRYIIGRAERVD